MDKLPQKQMAVRQIIGTVCLLLCCSIMSAFAQEPAQGGSLLGMAGKNKLQPAYINRIENIDFRRGEQGEGRVLVFLQGPAVAVNVSEQSGKLEVEFFHTDIPDSLLYQLDVMDFGTVVKGIETFKAGLSSRLIIETTADVNYHHRQDGSRFVLVLEPKVTQHKTKAERQYQGKPISLNFRDIPVRSALKILADYNHFNLVVSDAVSGDLTLRLDNTPWDQALDIVLQVKGLGKRMEGNILLVASSEEWAAREARELQAGLLKEDLELLHTDFLPVHYAKAAELAQLLNNSQSSMLSARGAVSVDARTNTILIRDTFNSIANARKLVKRLDIPVRQVLIESRMITVRDNMLDELGIRWGFSEQQSRDHSTLGISGNAAGANAIGAGQRPALNDRWNVNLPASTTPAGSIAFHIARLADGRLLDLELSALEQENKGEIIASPRITTANQQQAHIEQGVEIPYVQAASSGATTVAFKKAVLSLTVTPHITPDNRIILDLLITQNTRGETVSTPTGPATAIDTQEIQTQVLVDNGETIVLGGIYQQQIISTVNKVPLLGDIPYMGRLFKNTQQIHEKNELLIFVTPKILAEVL